VGWREAELVRSPHAHTDKAAKVRGMFAAIAPSYDLNNRLHSLWRDQAWRRFAVRQAGVQPGEVVADVACGTGDLTQAFAATPASRILGLDFTPQMLDVARTKQRALRPADADRISYQEADAQNLPLGDASVDVLSIAFGIRNVQQPPRAMAEFFRVLRPGGRLIVLEFDQPRFPPLRWFNAVYCATIMPRTATLISGDRSGAYRYLPKSVETFLTREQLLGLITSAGFTQAKATPLTMGICVCYRAEKPR
jgi:demethylmenaquinone methyltransferase/2-methoxy-6-polyprenyl-1,4-benzoquinol methylase